MGLEFGFWIAPNWSYIRKMAMASQISDMASLSVFFDVVFFVRFTYWFKFRVNIITGSEVKTIFFCKELTRNPEIGNTPVWVLLNIWIKERANNTKFSSNVFNKMLLNATKFQGYSFYPFWVVGGKPTGMEG